MASAITGLTRNAVQSAAIASRRKVLSSCEVTKIILESALGGMHFKLFTKPMPFKRGV